MPNSDSNIYNYNVLKLKNNIKRILKERNITQTTLSEKIGMPQSRISKILKSNDSDCFTVQQLAAIANYLHISVDTLLGIEPNKKNDQKDISLSDVIQKLFEINELTPIKIGTCATGNLELIDQFTGETIPEETHCIYFGNQCIRKLLEEWADLTALNTETKQKILKLWQEDTLSRNTERLYKWNFRNKREEGFRLAQYYLSGLAPNTPDECFCVIPPKKEELELLNWYLMEYAWKDLEDNDYGLLNDIVSSFEDRPKNDNNDDIEKLPFH